MFTAALFIISPNWKQLECPSTGKWINKMQYAHSMESSPIKRNEPLINTTTWNLMPSDENQTQKTTACRIPFVQNGMTDVF